MKNSTIQKTTTILSKAHASLALVKYWGKQSNRTNIPSCTSIAVTLQGLDSSLILKKTKSNTNSTNVLLFVNNKQQENSRLEILLQYLKKNYKDQYNQNIAGHSITLNAKNSFPTSAGLASSSSGGAALSLALAKALQIKTSQKTASQLARIYSGSACRSVFGGFVEWQKGLGYAQSFANQNHWSDFRVIVIAVTQKEKKHSSRNAMSITKNTSPYYRPWVKYNNTLASDAKKAILTKDIAKLGEIATKSYTAMHASALSAYPPILYWHANTITVLQEVRALQKQNIAVWETMDAGPQIKLLTLSKHVATIKKHITQCIPNVWTKVCSVGGSAIVSK